MIINDLYNNKPSLSEGMKARDLAMYCEKLVAEKGWDAAYKHALMMANVGRDPAWNGVLKYLDAMKQGVTEGTGNIGNAIKSLYQKIYNAGDDEIEYFYHDSPIFAQYWDQYEGDLDSIIAEVDPKELQIMHDELESYVQQAGLAEGRMVKGPGGVPLDRRGNPIVAKAKAPEPKGMRKWLVIHDGSHGEGGKDIIEAPNAETAYELANEYDLYIIDIKPYRGPAGPTLVDEGVAEGSDPDWWKKLPKDQLDALAGKRYPKDKKPTKPVSEVSLGDYRKKAALSKATSQIDRFFGRDDPAKVAQADQTIAKRERGMARADARVKPYTAPPVDVEKRQRDLTAKYPNIDELVRRAELNRDPNYEMADGPAYYAGREAEQNYLKLKQIQRVIQGLNESQADTKKKELSTGTGRINPDTGRPWLPSELKAKYANVDFDKEATKAELKRLSDLAKQEKLKDKIKASLDDPRDTARDLAKSLINKGGLGSDFKTPSPVPPTPSPGPTTVQGQPPGFTAGNLAQQPGMSPYMQQKPAAPKPALNFAQGPTGYKTATTNVPPTMSTTTAPPAEKNTSDILQALTKMGFKTKEAEAAIKRLPPNIGTNDAILQILRGKQMSESLTWSRNFNPGRSLYRRMKQDI